MTCSFQRQLQAREAGAQLVSREFVQKFAPGLSAYQSRRSWHGQHGAATPRHVLSASPTWLVVVLFVQNKGGTSGRQFSAPFLDIATVKQKRE